MPKGINIAIICIVFLCIFIGKTISTVPLVPLLIVGSIFLFIFAFVYTDSAMVLLIFAMLLSPELVLGALSKQKDIVIRIDDLLIVVFTCAWLARTAITKNHRFIRKLPLNRLIFFYCAVFILSTLQGMIFGKVVPAKGFFFMVKYIEYFMVFFLAAGIIQDKKQMTMYLKAFLVVFAIVNIYAFLQIGHVDRVSAPFQTKGGEPNTLGGYQVLMLGVLIGLLTHTYLRQWKWPLIALALFTLVPLGYTLSRASYVALIPMYLTAIAVTRSSAKTVLIGVFITGVIAFMIFKPPDIVNRLSETFVAEYQEDIPPVEIWGITLGASPSARVLDWIELFDLWKQKPFLGYGLTGARFVDSQFIKELVETGLLGLTAFMLLMIKIFQRTLKIYKTTKDDLYKGLAAGFLAGHVGMLFHALTANTFIIIRIMEPYWFLAAMVMMIPQLEQQQSTAAVTGPKKKEQYVNNVTLLLGGRAA